MKIIEQNIGSNLGGQQKHHFSQVPYMPDPGFLNQFLSKSNEVQLDSSPLPKPKMKPKPKEFEFSKTSAQQSVPNKMIIDRGLIEKIKKNKKEGTPKLPLKKKTQQVNVSDYNNQQALPKHKETNQSFVETWDIHDSMQSIKKASIEDDYHFS